MSFFCPDCGGLMQRRAVRGEVQSVCPRCSPGPTAWWNRDAGSSKRDTVGDAPRAALESFASIGTPKTARARREAAADAGDAEGAKKPRAPRAPKEPVDAPVIELPPGADLFPYSAVRDGQREFLADVAAAAEGRKILVANAPTGLGKTVSSLAPLVTYALRNKKRVFFLTSKQSQHKIAIDTLRAIRKKAGVPLVVSDVIGKQDMCPRREARELFPVRFAEFCRRQVLHKECEYYENDNKAALKQLAERIHHVDETTMLGADMMVCPHQTALDLAAQAHVVVCDYNYFFSHMREGVQERLRIDLAQSLLVVDEAHNLPDRIRDHLTLTLNDYSIEAALDELREIKESRLSRIVEGLRDVVVALETPRAARDDADEGGAAPAARGWEGERLVPREEFVSAVNEHLSRGVASLTISDYAAFVTDLEAAIGEYAESEKEDPRGLMALRDFLVNWRRERPGLARIWKRDPVATLTYQMLDPAVLARGVFEAAHAAVIMSGTLHPGEMYRDVLGLPAERTVVKYYRSPFPPENRLLLVDGSATTSYQERGSAMNERIAGNLAAIAEATPGNVAAFFPSYAILEGVRPYLEDLVRNKKLVVEERQLSKGEKEGLVDVMRRASENALLCGVQGGSLSEGYDYEDNLLKGVVIVGLPFGPPSLYVQALIDYYEKKFPGKGRDYAYVYPTMNRVLQAAGRAIRSEGDRGAIVLMDKRFDWSSYRATYPVDFKPRLARDPVDDVRRFWG